ncbi:MAG: N-acetylmuramoyl-L-alanine amidase [Vicinamibacterales bacterium]
MARLDPARMPSCEMVRVILHWTAGTHTASPLAREHYHVLVEGTGSIVYGQHGIDANAKPAREPRASHTRNCNTGSIGVAVCCMLNATERPFSAGPFPMTPTQWQIAAEVVAELCARYDIAVTPKTVLAHGEVQATLGKEQLGKWDPTVLPWSPTTSRQQVMDEFRAAVRRHLTREDRDEGGTAALAAPPPPPGAAADIPAFPQSLDWADDSAILLVHGVGNAKPGDYRDVQDAVRAAAGGSPAVYTLFYDVFNDWRTEKMQVKEQLGRLTAGLKQRADGVSDTIAEFAGDVVWPLFSEPARVTVLTAFRAQLRQMVLDGMRSRGKIPGQLKFSIVCHSLGCFYTYELLHQIATDSRLRLRPATEGVQFRAVVFMASPVQLIRTLAGGVAPLIPGNLATLAPAGLSIPFEMAFGSPVKSVRRWVAVAGDLDPIGGHFFHTRADWAFMNLAEPEATTIVDPQTLTGGAGTEQVLLNALLSAARRDDQPPSIGLENPHSWLGYVGRHQGDLAQWLA